MWRVAVNTINKQLQVSDKEWSSILCVGLRTPHYKKTNTLQNITLAELLKKGSAQLSYLLKKQEEKYSFII
jgi:hypothetical protein